ncbi:PEP-CTERM sorting domain-containing protein [Desertibaculum subflavum]|uniref:PEP-CTERM sorting domain-containing protein n=1 Tax=Desertibaculum subflavum TaxID=2268458 RepID=UPI000E663AD2
MYDRFGGALRRAGAALALAMAGLGLASGSAGAVSVAFSGTSGDGTDPLGHSWDFKLTISPLELQWYLPKRESLSTKFNLTSAISNGNGDWATGFRIAFAFPAASGFAIDTTPGTTALLAEATRFVNFDTNELWDTTFIGTSEVLFTAPAGSRIDVGDVFLLQILTTQGAGSSADFKDGVPFTAQWLDGSEGTAIPAPASLPLLAAGIAALGLARRRRMEP